MSYTPHVIENTSSMNNVYQKTGNKVPPHKKRWITPILLECPKNKIFQTPDF